MNFLIDEDVPIQLIPTLRALGHSAERVSTSSSDITNALRATRENKILITLDKDFANTIIFSPTKFDIILVDFHPPLKGPIIKAMTQLLKTTPPEKFKGLILLQENGSVRITE